LIAGNPILLEIKDIIYSPIEQNWANCRRRARILVLTPVVSLTALFWLVFGLAYAIIGNDTDGWTIVAMVGITLLAVITFDNLKLWIILYPLIFIAPRLKLGDWTAGGEEKLFGIQLYEPIILIVLCLWIPGLIASRRLDLPKILKVAAAALGLIGLNAIRIAPDRMVAVRDAGRLFYEPLLMFAVIASLRWRRTEVRSAALGFVCVAALVAAISIAGYGTPKRFRPAGAAAGATQTERLDSYWEGTNSLAAFLVAAAPITLGVIVSSDSLMRLTAALGAVLLELTAIILTYTRGAWIALTASLLTMAFQLRRIRWPVIGLLLLIGVAAAAPTEMIERAASIAAFKSEQSVENRIHMWHYAVPLVEQKPLAGYGFGGFLCFSVTSRE
jgi:O-antigen ligase